MSFRVEYSKDEPILVPSCLVNDNTISISARFLLIVIWSLPTDKFNVNEVSKIIKRNPSTTYKYLNELIKSGYIKRSNDGYEVKIEK